MVLVGVGWPITLYYLLLQNVTPAVLLLGCFTLLMMHVYPFYVYFVDPFSPGKPLEHGQKIYARVVLVITLVNLFLLIAAGLAQGIVMTQAWAAKLLADQMIATADLLSLDSPGGKVGLTDQSAENSPDSVFLPSPEEKGTSRVNPIPKPRNWFWWKSSLVDPSVEDIVNKPSKAKTLKFQQDAAAALTGREGAGDIYDAKELGVNTGDSMLSTHHVRGLVDGKESNVYLSCAKKAEILKGIQDYNQEESRLQREFLRISSQMAIPYKNGRLAYTANPGGGLDVHKGPLELVDAGKLPPLVVGNYTPESPLASQNSPSLGLKAFRDTFNR